MNQKEQVVVAALLHDVGKVMQRAEVGCRTLADEAVKQRLCPRTGRGGSYSHLHVVWTEDYLRSIETLFWPTEPFAAPDDNIPNLAACHHLPSTPLQKLIAQADCMSAGMDRVERSEDDVSGQAGGINVYKRVRLRSVFPAIDIGQGVPAEGSWVHELRTLQIGEPLFPKREGSAASLVSEYRALWDGFSKEVEQSSWLGGRENLLYQRLDWLSQKYFWCVPSSTVSEPDISLYDHARTTAAIAGAMYDFHVATASLDARSVEDRTTKKFRLLSGDLSGIQHALFNFDPGHNKGVAKMLRAKSFYLSIITEAVLQLLAGSGLLHPAQTVLNAGGRFLALLPNLPEIEGRLSSLRREIDQWCLERFDGQMTVVLDWSVTASPQDFFDKNFKRLLGDVAQALDEAKKRRLAGALIDPQSGGWRPAAGFLLTSQYTAYRQNGKCITCGQEPAREPGGDGDRCAEYKELGRKLVKDPVLLWNRSGNGLPFFGGAVNLDVRAAGQLTEAQIDESVTRVDEINRPDAAVAARFFANHVPVYDREDQVLVQALRRRGEDIELGDILPLLGIAWQGARDGGALMLGVVKGDVDRLGTIFSYGLSANRFSISRYVGLSRMIDEFFSGHLNYLATNEFPNAYVVYAGGDDFLFISDWKSAIGFADRLEKDFRRFTTHNPNITLSVGLAVTGPRYPVRLGATRAETLLDTAKESGRSRFSLLGSTVEWPVFRDKLRKLHDDLDRWETEQIVPRSFLHRLLRYFRMHREVPSDPSAAIYRALMAYDIKRNIERKADHGPTEDKVAEQERRRAVRRLQELFDLSSQDASLMDHLCIPVQWVLYQKRDREE